MYRTVAFRLVMSTASCVILLVLFWTTPAITISSKFLIQQETAERHIQIAHEAYKSKKYDAAKDEAKLALSLDKRMPSAHLLLGMIDWRQGKWDNAARHIKEALKWKPDYADAHLFMGVLDFQRGDLGEARKETETAISGGLRSATAFALLGQIKLATNKPEEALEAFEKAKQLTSPGDESETSLNTKIEAIRGWIESKAERTDQSYVKPRLLNNPMPKYAEEARHAGIQGSVHIGILINEEGKVISAFVFRGLGFGLDEEALRAAQALKFLPATKNGKPVSYWLKVEVEFKLG
ncbi:MAG TPA: TonB family protein [Blastocatellia bacterium]